MTTETNVKQAAEHIQARYRALSTYANKISQIGIESGKPVPCSLLATYHAAVRDYLRFGTAFFNALDKKKIQVDQIIMTGGKPKLDAKGRPKALRISAPLRPPVFITNKDFCPSAALVAGEATVTVTSFTRPRRQPLSGDSRTLVGLGPLVIPVAMMVGTWAFRLGAIYLSTVALEKLAAVIQGHPPNYNLDKQIEAGLTGYTNILKAGGSPEQAAAALKQAAVPPPPPPPSSFFAGLGSNALLIGLGVLAVGGGLYFYKSSSGAAAPAAA
jgi:hypothetical protein